MKKLCLNLIICLCVALTACQKGDSSLQTSEIVGKWQETKLNLHQTDAQARVHDTTYTAANFTDLDFYQFNRDETAVISKTGNFSFAGKAIVIPALYISDWVTHYTYNVADTVVNFNPADGISTSERVVPFIKSQTIVKLDDSQLVLRTAYDFHYTPTANLQGSYLSGLVTTAYFTRLK